MTDNGQQTTTNTQVTTDTTASGQAGGENRPETLSLTTAQLNERLERAQRSAMTKFFESIGVADADALKGVIDEHKKLKSASQTDAEKQVAALEELKGKLAAEIEAHNKAKTQLTELEQARVTDRVNSAIESAANKLGAKNSDDVLVLLRTKQADKIKALVNDKGEIAAKAVEDLVTEFKTANPVYFGGGGPGSPPNRGGKTPEPDKEAKDAARLDFRNKIRRMG